MQEQSSGEPIDLQAYLEHVGVRTCVAADLQTLRDIVAAHVATIPFENIDPFLGVVPALDIASVQRKLVRDGRGGYCFEQNRLLGDVLRAIGFRVTDLAARVLWGQTEDAITARSHMLLHVDIDDEPWLADVGFGGSTPTGPLRLVADIEQATPHETFRLRQCGCDWYLSVQIGDEWKPMYRFDLRPQYPIDYTVSNYWLATRAVSHFVASLVAARAPIGRRLALHNHQFTEHLAGGATTRQTLANAAEVRAVLREQFLLNVPDGDAFDDKFDKLMD
jgi:N-hydroxyarylamine O-acetyltransferase